MMTLNEGSVVAITGAGSGIGAACAAAFLAKGARVALAARRLDRLEAVAKASGEDRVLAKAMDVRLPEDNRRFVDAALKHFGRLDAFVASAGIGMYGSILDYSDSEYAEMIDVNYAGTVWGIRAAVPALLKEDGGDLVIVASVAGLRGGPNEAVYAGTKAAQIGLAGALDRELSPKGIRVSVLCPAAVDTEFAIGKGRSSGDPWLREVLRPEDVAQAVVTILEQPRHMRTTQWAMWAMTESS